MGVGGVNDGDEVDDDADDDDAEDANEDDDDEDDDVNDNDDDILFAEAAAAALDAAAAAIVVSIVAGVLEVAVKDVSASAITDDDAANVDTGNTPNPLSSIVSFISMLRYVAPFAVLYAEAVSMLLPLSLLLRLSQFVLLQFVYVLQREMMIFWELLQQRNPFLIWLIAMEHRRGQSNANNSIKSSKAFKAMNCCSEGF